MPTTKTISGEGLVRRLVGIGFAIVKLDDEDGKRGECKAFAGDHVCEITTKRPAKYGDREFDILKAEKDPPEEQVEVTRICRFVLTPDAAESLGVTLGDTASGADAVNGWTPEGSEPPENFGALEGIVASPTTPWVDGQHVVLGDGSTAYWNGSIWVAGEAPGAPVSATGATAGNPGSFTPSGAAAPADLAAMTGITASPSTAWLTGEHVVLGDASHASWDGLAWVAGDGVGVVGFSGQSTPTKSGVVADHF
jgi:hypothetical protein